MDNRRFTISVFTENQIGILNRITIVFTRRHLNILSITASESEVKDVYRYTIVLEASKAQVDKVVAQLEKLLDVLRAFVHEEEEVVHQELALYKLRWTAATQAEIERVVRAHYARVLALSGEYIVIEKTGHQEETQALFELLKPLGVLEFARSGRVAVTKPMKELSTYLEELEQEQV